MEATVAVVLEFHSMSSGMNIPQVSLVTDVVQLLVTHIDSGLAVMYRTGNLATASPLGSNAEQPQMALERSGVQQLANLISAADGEVAWGTLSRYMNLQHLP